MGTTWRRCGGWTSGSAALIYIDPPFNTGRRQSRLRMKTVRDEAGDRVGFGGRRYRTELMLQAAEAMAGYADQFDDFLGFLRPRLVEAHRVLAATGSLFFHIDPREVHYCKVMLDEISICGPGRAGVLSERDHLGVRLRRAGDEALAGEARQHPLVHARSGAVHVQPGRERPHSVHGPGAGGRGEGGAGQDADGCVVAHDRVADGQGEDRVRDAEAAGDPGADCAGAFQSGRVVLDFFAGSGTTGEAAAKHGREFLLVDESAEAVAVMGKRLGGHLPFPPIA